ncbi:MAG: RDD family protein [Acidobacteriota bacterium]
MATIEKWLMTSRAAGLVSRQHSPRCECGARLPNAASFCPACGAAAHTIQSSAVTSRQSTVARRLLAEVIDRLAPLPFIAYVFPPWVFVVIAYHLICDGSPSGRGPGKWIFRLRVVSVSSKQPCGICRAALRRLSIALGQAAYCTWALVPFAIAYELVSLAFVWLNPTGRRIEDYLAATQVISEGQYQKLRPVCTGCGERVPVSTKYCPHCGTRGCS